MVCSHPTLPQQNPAEIILKPELDKLVALWPERFTVHYVVDKPCGGWAGRTGYVDAGEPQ